MKRWRYFLALAATLLAAALPAHAFVLSGPTEVAVATPFTITLKGTLESVEQLSVLIDYPSLLVGLQTPCSSSSTVSFMDPGVVGQSGALEGLLPDSPYPCLYQAISITDLFSVVDDAILNVGFESLLNTGSATITFYTCVLETCGGVQQSADWSASEWTVRIGTGNPGNSVPEPATLWLAAAALIAGGLIFRKDSKSS